MGLSLKRLESNALRELSLILRADAKNKGFNMVSVTEVRITNDLSYMTVFYTFYGGKKEAHEKNLNDCKGYLRTELARKLNARKMPDLIFKYDDALEYGNRINDVIAEIHKREENK